MRGSAWAVDAERWTPAARAPRNHPGVLGRPASMHPARRGSRRSSGTGATVQSTALPSRGAPQAPRVVCCADEGVRSGVQQTGRPGNYHPGLSRARIGALFFFFFYYYYYYLLTPTLTQT